MNKKRFCKVMMAPALSGMGLLLLFLLLGWRIADATSDEYAGVNKIQVHGANFVAAETMLDTGDLASVNNLGVCGDVWITETVDSVGDVGADDSLALAPTPPYTPYISYRDYITSENYNLKYTWLSGTTWFSETVDSGGEWTSLVLMPSKPYSPFIIHHHWWEWDLKYACRNDTTWITGTIEGLMRANRGSLALEQTYPYTPHVSYYLPWGTAQTLYYAYFSGTTWCNGTWVKENVEPLLSEAGWSSSLALESTYPYTPHISYYDSQNRDLKHAWKGNTTWFSQIVDSEGDVGWRFISLALDSGDNPHIAYYDATNTDLKYTWLSGATWLSETVDSAGDVGQYTSLALDNNDYPFISYYDATNGDLNLAHFNGTAWITQTVDSVADVGQYSSLALDQVGCPHISYYDRTNLDLKYAYLSPIMDYLPIIMKN